MRRRISVHRTRRHELELIHREKIDKLDPISPAFHPPPDLPGGSPPICVQPRPHTAHSAAPHIPGPTQQPAQPSLIATNVAATTFHSTLRDQSLRTTLYAMADTGLAITSLLQDAFRRFYGDGWEEAYRQPVIKDFFLREVRAELSRGAYGKSVETINRQVELSEARRTSACVSTQPEAPAKCPCPLHEVFGAAEDLHFPTCPRENQLWRNREWEGIEFPHQQ